MKDMRLLGRDLSQLIIVDNSSFSYMLQPENAIASDTWTCDKECEQLLEIAEYLEALADVPDVREHTHRWNKAVSTFEF